MTWFLVALMATMSPIGEVDVYVFTDPTFQTVDECLLYAKENPQPIIKKLYEEFGGVPLNNLLCATQEQLEKAFDAVPKIRT